MPSLLWLCRAAQTTAAVGLAGFLVVRLLARGTAFADARYFRRWTLGCWVGLWVTDLLRLGLTAAEMSGLPLTQAIGAGTIRQVLHGTDFGAAWNLRAGLLVGLLVTGWCAARRRMSVTADALALALTAALLGSLVWTGHARMSAQSGWLFPMNALHILAAGVWPGGLLGLGLGLARARRDPASVPAMVTITRRFSRLSGVAVGVLTCSGVLGAGGLVGTFAALWTSLYGGLLLGKVALFAGMVALGAVNRRLLRQEGSADPGAVVRSLARRVGWEGVLAVGVLLATEALAMSTPPVAPR